MQKMNVTKMHVQPIKIRLILDKYQNDGVLHHFIHVTFGILCQHLKRYACNMSVKVK